MEFRKSTKEDLTDIMAIIRDAQAYFKNNNIDQWQNGYPNEDSILSDIESKESYVLVDDNEIIGTAYISFAGEILKVIEKICLERDIHDIKIDTHRDNKSMQRFLEKQGFTRCGVVYLKDKSERIGFEKLI